jgi:hypothetical protein
MGLPLKVAVACSEAAVALRDAAAATYLSAGFRLFRFRRRRGCVGGWGEGLARVVWLVVLGVLLFAAVNLLAP